MFAPFFEIYDSDIFTRRLRADPRMLEMMGRAADSQKPYSLLAALETRDRFSQKVSKSPLVIIPDTELTSLVEWENANIIHGLQKYSGIKTVSRGQYLNG